MRKIVCIVLIFVMMITCVPLVACNGGGAGNSVKFTYDDVDYQPTLGERTNDEKYNYDEIFVNPVEGMREDFIMGVDASMVATIEECGGVYYNKDGVEQDVFQIMADNGVNFFRVRVWNEPYDMYGEGFGGGNVDVDAAVEMCKRAEAVGMNILVDFHYSDFWADPETQDIPASWASLTKDELVTELGEYTSSSLKKFKNAGITVDIVQIGNEINNGMLFPSAEITWGYEESASFEYLSRLLKAGISAAKEVYPETYTAIHLANGGNFEEFDTYFGYLEDNKVNYDIIGASYYPYYHGTLDALQNNLDKISAKYKRPVYVAETSYGFTTDYNQNTANIYNETFEDVGGYLTSIQGQATEIRDVIEVVANVPDSMGLGLFYWEPAWLPVEGADWATGTSGRVEGNGLATWSNQALFSYTGKVLPSMQVFNLVKTGSQPAEEVAVALRDTEVSYTLNIADNETMPTTVAVETNLDAIRQFPVTWDSEPSTVGNYTVTGTVEGVSGKVTANVEVIRNFIKDPGYENQSMASDAIGAPWSISAQTPAGEKVVKLDRKTDTRTGIADLNWYYVGGAYSFTVEQTVNLEAGNYELSVYCMAEQHAAQTITVFIEYNNGQRKEFDLSNVVEGWGAKDEYYKKAIISDIQVTGGSARIGVTVNVTATGSALSQIWGHMDDWALVLVD